MLTKIVQCYKKAITNKPLKGMALPPDELPLFSALLSTLCALSLERSLAWTRLPLLGLLSEPKSLKKN